MWFGEIHASAFSQRAGVARQAGLISGFAFPVLVGDDVVAVLEFFTDEVLEPDETLLEVMTQIGTQLGRVYERQHLEAALHRGEEQLREIIDLVPHFIFIKDAEGRYRLVNKALADLHGATPEALIGSIHGTAGSLPEDTEGYLATDREVIATGRPVVVPQEFVRDHEGNVRIMRTTKVPYIDPETGETLVLGVAVDITELQRTEDELRHVQKLDALGKLTGGIAHDFNNLLTIILGNIQLVERSIEDPRMRKFVASAEAAAQRGAELTKRLLAFGRRQPLAPKVMDLNELLLGLTDLLTRTIGANIEIRSKTSPGLHMTLADPAQVENAVLNLAINARDAMPDGGILTIETANVRLGENDAALHGEITPGDYVVVAVGDTGAGMTPEIVERAFDPFFTTKEVGRGSGLDLSMVYGFCQQSGGHAVIESDVGVGTTISIYLPDASEKKDESEAPGGTVLVVEDDPAVRSFAVMTLNGLGYKVLEAADAEVAKNVLEADGRIDLLFTDIILPNGADGRELAASATARYPGIRVLYTTGFSLDEIYDERWETDEVELLCKPYSVKDLAANVDQLLDGAR